MTEHSLHPNNCTWHPLLRSWKNEFPLSRLSITSDLQKVEASPSPGAVSAIRLETDWGKTLLLPIEEKKKGRQVGPPEIEFGIISAQEAFVEVLDTNLNLVRRRLPTPNLKVEEKTVGTLFPNKSMPYVYIEDIASPRGKHRNGSSANWGRWLWSDFRCELPRSNALWCIQYHLSVVFEYRRDPTACLRGLSEGKIAILVDGSPHVLLAPTILLGYFFHYGRLQYVMDCGFLLDCYAYLLWYFPFLRHLYM